MPVFTLTTNVPQSKISVDFLKDISDQVGKALNKPQEYMQIHARGDQAIIFDNSDAPAGFATLKSIGGISPAQNQVLAGVIFPIVEKHLGIVGRRLYVDFINLKSSDISHQGRTFEGIL